MSKYLKHVLSALTNIKLAFERWFVDTEKKQLKLDLQHQCQLPNMDKDLLVQFIDSGYFVDFRRRFRSMMMCSDLNPRSKMFLKSAAAISLEKQSHLQFNYYMIHPFSMMRVMWEEFMMIILCVLLVYIPIDVCFTNQRRTVSNCAPKIFLDGVCWIDICMSFATGYQDNITKKVIMAPKKVAINYVKTWFILDSLSSINADIFILALDATDKDAWMYKLPSFLKIFRLATLLKYLDRFREWKQYSLYKFKLMKLILFMILMIIWNSCLLYLMAKHFHEVWLPRNKKPGEETSREVWEGLRLCFIRIVMCFMLVAHGEKNSETLEIIGFEICWLSTGWIVKLAATAQIVQMIMKYSSLSDKYHQMVQQFQEYMKSKNLPDTVRKRVLAYFEFRFQRNYYKENEILGSLSNQLKQEIIVHTCKHLLANTVIFQDIPYQFLVRLSFAMKMEIFLPNDVVVSAGTDANGMYFILTGMVALYDNFGREVCHMADGGYFGEMSLFLADQKRNVSIVSIDFCEMYTLKKSDFAEAVAPYPDLLDKIEGQARKKLQEFLDHEEARKTISTDSLLNGSKSIKSRTRSFYHV